LRGKKPVKLGERERGGTAHGCMQIELAFGLKLGVGRGPASPGKKRGGKKPTFPGEVPQKNFKGKLENPHAISGRGRKRLYD